MRMTGGKTQRWIAAVVVFLAVVAWAPTARAQKEPDGLFTASKEQLAVVKVVLMQESAWNRGNLDEFLESYKVAPETQAIIGGSVRGMANIKSAYHINYPNRDSMGVIAYSNVEARELGENFALATGKYHLDRPKRAGGSAEGTFTLIMEKTLIGWKIIFSETT